MTSDRVGGFSFYHDIYELLFLRQVIYLSKTFGDYGFSEPSSFFSTSFQRQILLPRPQRWSHNPGWACHTMSHPTLTVTFGPGHFLCGEKCIYSNAWLWGYKNVAATARHHVMFHVAGERTLRTEKTSRGEKRENTCQRGSWLFSRASRVRMAAALHVIFRIYEPLKQVSFLQISCLSCLEFSL